MRRRYARWLTAALLVWGLGNSTTYACSTDTACDVDNGEYFIELPDTPSGKTPAIVYIHGFGGSGNGVFRNRTMVTAFLDRGYAVIAPNGLPRQNGNGRSWAFHPWFDAQRDEFDFLSKVKSDAVERFDLDAERILLGGFSIGGSMTAYTACKTPDAFTAYAPLGGNFWRPHPEQCEGPVRMIHTHGWRDGTVPLEGRVLRGEDSRDPDALIQGDIFHAMQIWRETNACFQLKADHFQTDQQFWHRRWDRCADGSALELVLFPGGHIVPKGWASLVLNWFEELQ